MRLKRTEVAEREAFLKELFTKVDAEGKRVDVTAKAANEALAEKFGGKKMRLAKVYQIKKDSAA